LRYLQNNFQWKLDVTAYLSLEHVECGMRLARVAVVAVHEAKSIKKSTICTSTNRHIRKPQVQINSSKILVDRALDLWSSTGPQAGNISVVTLTFGTPGPPWTQVEPEAAAV
jgi:hypothetical protein